MPDIPEDTNPNDPWYGCVLAIAFAWLMLMMVAVIVGIYLALKNWG